MLLGCVELLLGVKGQNAEVTGREQGSRKQSARKFWSDPRNAFRKGAPLMLCSVPPEACLQATARALRGWPPPGSPLGSSLLFPVAHIALSSQCEVTQLRVSVTLKTEVVRGRKGLSSLTVQPLTQLLAQNPSFSRAAWNRNRAPFSESQLCRRQVCPHQPRFLPGD